jgi:uracil-DNA glycosylase family 4
VDARQDTIANPFGMDETCEQCPELCDPRTQVVHGYGDVAADFLFVGERPAPDADRDGVPFAGLDAMDRILSALGFYDGDTEIDNAFLTHLTRCRHDERVPTDEEVLTCEPYLNAEIRMINPEIIVPVGERALVEIATEYTTTPADEFSLPDDHATTIRGRGFEIVPLVDPADASDEQVETFLEHFEDIFGRDYRQTKGRRGR